MILQGNIVDLHQRSIYFGEIRVEAGRLTAVTPLEGSGEHFILPGFIDAHIHIESSMLIPSEFARLATVHGTVATVSDPHEIGNVLGVKGVEYMIANGGEVPFKFFFGAPSCVPATDFETAGAVIDAADLDRLLSRPEIKYLSEMMNYPGVIHRDAKVLEKIAIANEHGKPIDGHAPGVTGADLDAYIRHGNIRTDHESFRLEEGREKLQKGMKLIIREGSAAKNYEALIPLIAEYPDQILFCSDDKHPDDLIQGHIDQLVRRAVADGYDLFDVLRAACLHPIEHYQLEVGCLRPGDPADFIIAKDLESFQVLQTYIDGQLVADQGRSLIPKVSTSVINNFAVGPVQKEDLRVLAASSRLQVIKALDGEIITDSYVTETVVSNGVAITDPSQDLLKMVVVNRYQNALPAAAFINGFGLRIGALASSVGHDSHNIIAVGVDDHSICRAINLLVEARGGIAAVGDGAEHLLPLPIAGIMTHADGHETAQSYAHIDRFVRLNLGSSLGAPYMTLSFMALLVIPQLKLSDKGLFDGSRFAFTNLFV